MSARPTNFYPSPPKLEHFLLRPTNIKVAGNTTAAPGTPSGNISSEYQQLNAAAYDTYLTEHHSWLLAIEKIDHILHERALVRRLHEDFREIISLDDESTRARTRAVLIGEERRDPGAPLQAVWGTVVTQRKVPHAPVVSTQPHQAEKRANRKKVRDARVKVQANVAEAKAELLLEKTVPVIKAQRSAIQKVVEQRPLHKAEETAAKSAAVRAASIMKSSPDLVAEVRPDDGWKLVTRKKGARSEVLASTTKMGAAGTQLHHATVTGDPALVRQPGKLLAATTRAPTSTGGR